jgi:hypothetical protein
MLLGVSDRCPFRMSSGVNGVRTSGVSVVGGFLMVPRLVMLSRFPVMPGSVGVMFWCLPVMFRSLLWHKPFSFLEVTPFISRVTPQSAFLCEQRRGKRDTSQRAKRRSPQFSLFEQVQKPTDCIGFFTVIRHLCVAGFWWNEQGSLDRRALFHTTVLISSGTLAGANFAVSKVQELAKIAIPLKITDMYRRLREDSEFSRCENHDRARDFVR